MSEKNRLSHDRCMELLNAVIDRASVARNTKETVIELLRSGLTTAELIRVFSFPEDDVNDAYREFKSE